MKEYGRSLFKKVFLGLFCVLFFIGSAVPALCAPKKPKKDKKDSTSVAETPTAIAESPTAIAESPTADDVDVYAEGAYTTGDAGDLAVYIYADINVGNLVSYGVKLNYATDKLENPVAEKNEAVWYMGDGTEAGNHTYMDPDTSTAGEIIFLGGKLDEASPMDGVTGTRKLLGKVTFSRTAATKTEDPGVNPEIYFGISLDLGRPDPDSPAITYDNFVSVSADGTVVTVKDDSGVSFIDPPTIRERGDANADGDINVADYIAIRNILNSTDFPPYADCNNDGSVNVADYICVRNKI